MKRLPKCKEVTIDLPEDPEETKLVMTPNTRKAVSTQKKKSFKCSICIEGLQVAGKTQVKGDVQWRNVGIRMCYVGPLLTGLFGAVKFPEDLLK